MQDSLEDYLKLLKNTKNNNETPQINKEVLITAQIKKEYDRRAMKIVELCIDGRLRSETLLKCLPYINQSHYQDIIEERSLIKLCGYPICGKKIPEMPKKQYFISTKLNKVYDITDRKNYCSNHCYKASIHVKKQIDNSPLWLRKFNELPKFNLLKKTDGGLPGEEVDQGVIKPIIEPSSSSSSSFTSISSFAEISLKDVVDNEIKTQHSRKTKDQNFNNQMTTISEDIEEIEDNVDESLQKESPKTQIKQKSTKVKEKKHNNTDYKLIEELILKLFKQWLSLDTFILIYGEDKMKQIINDEKLNNYFDKLHITELNLEQQKKYVEICKKLNLRELTEQKFDNRLINNIILKPLPDYQQLKEENRHIDLKVKSFYNGTINIEHDTNDRIKKLESNDDEQTIVLPLIDNKSQNALRRNIFLKSLNKAIAQLLNSLKVESSIIMPDIPPLVKTFKLTANNIVFKPIIWTFIAIGLLKILALKNEDVKEILNRQSSIEYLDSIMNCLPSKSSFVDDILNLIQNVDEFAKFYITTELV